MMNRHVTPTAEQAATLPALHSMDAHIKRKEQALMKWQGACLTLLFVILLLAFL